MCFRIGRIVKMGTLIVKMGHKYKRPIPELFPFYLSCAAVRRCLSWRGWASWARLSFGALLLHMPINKSLVAARLMPSMLDRQSAILEWFGVAAVSYMTALPLALLVELPAQRLHRALSRGPPAPPARDNKPTEKADL